MLISKAGHWRTSSSTHHSGWPVIAAIIAISVFCGTSAEAATITVNSLADPGAPGICVLRDAITAANTETAVNGCPAGSGDDTIVFSVIGTISLRTTLPAIVNTLTLQGPSANPPAITISGVDTTQVTVVNNGAILDLSYLTIEGAAFNGIFNEGTLTVTNSTIADNGFAVLFGVVNGGIFNEGTLTVTNSTFSGNRAFVGGGIDNESGAVMVTNSNFTSNEAAEGGGIANGGMLTITNSTFAGNSVSNSNAFGDNPEGEAFGGGIANGGTLTVTNSTFVGNSSRNIYPGSGFVFGGGIFGGGTVTNSTFVGNSSTGVGAFGGGIVGGIIKGSILVGNSGGNCYGGVIDEGYNLDDDGTCDFSSGTTPDSAIALDPNGLQNNGGPTETVALESNSVAINQIPIPDCIDQSSPPVRLYTDQRGVIRPQFTACDIGAYEYDTAHSLKTNVLNAIDGTTGLSRQDQQKLKLAAGSLYQAALLLSSSGNAVNPTLGGAEFSDEQAAIQLLTAITPSSSLSEATLDTWLFNITLADRTLAVVAITNSGGNSEASQLVTDGDTAVASGYYLAALKDYAQAWRLAVS